MASTSKISIDGIKYDIRDDTLREGINNKQDKLIAGEGIELVQNDDGTITVNKIESIEE